MRALISTIQPVSGGVPAKTRWLVQELAALGITSTLAWYEPWSCTPELSVPMGGLLSGRRPGERREEVWPRVPGVGIGSWLPELEFSHYWPTQPWRRLIADHDLHLATTGNPLCAYRYLKAAMPFLAWVGTPWHGDRAARVRRFPWHRRLLDRNVNGPVLRRMERHVLRAPQGRILTISRHTAVELEGLSGRPTAGVLYLPPDPALFRPKPAERVPWRIGFAGRYGDPRKQLPLLLDAVQLLHQKGQPVELELTGERDGQSLLAGALEQRRLRSAVQCHPYLDPAQLAQVMQRWDLFVIPSHQEGLCISALEAMACGVPVVSTRCGGPEDFVLPGRTGTLVPHEAPALAAAIEAICSQPSLRHQISAGALAWMAANADASEARRRLRHHLHAAFPVLDDRHG
jgi:glycosyltransferase involved in cell wall biosynthesis